jgi:hypothetical protein
VKYRVVVTATVDLDIDEAVLALSDDEGWVRDFYGLETPEMVAEHLAWNVALHGRSLSHLDGFADRQDDAVLVGAIDVEYETERIEP